MSSKRSTSKRKSTTRTKPPTGVPEIDDYIELVLSGSIPACKEQYQLVRYVKQTFRRQKLKVDREQLDGYLSYARCFPFELMPEEKFLLALFMCTYRCDGLPRWSQALLYVGRGFGKNGFGGFIAFCAMTKKNGIHDYDVDICANSEEQAKTSFDDIYNILDNRRSTYEKAWSWNQVVIKNKSTGSRLRYRTDNPKSKDGLRSGMVIFDEVHAYTNWKNINVFTTGLGKKPHPRRLYLTTDGDVRDGVLDALKERSKKILNGEAKDNGFLPFICKLDDAKEVHNKENWPKANARIRYSKTLLAQIEQEYEDFIIDPANNSDFMTKRMNIPQGSPDLEVATWDDIIHTKQDFPSLVGEPCVCGIDFAKTTDFISAVLLFRQEGVYYVKHHSWFCTNSKDRARIKAPLEEWQAQGLLTIVDDVEIHPDCITEWIYDMSHNYAIQQIGIDSYRHSFFMRELADIGWYAKDGAVKLLRPSDVMKAQPKINSAFVNRRFVWGDDPMLRWCTNNAKLEAAPHGNYTYGKIEPKSRKTDAFMALVAAMCVEDEIPETGPLEYFYPVSV